MKLSDLQARFAISICRTRATQLSTQKRSSLHWRWIKCSNWQTGEKLPKCKMIWYDMIWYDMIWHNGLNMFENVWTIWNGTELIDLTWFKALQIIASHRSKKVLNTLSPSLLCDTARLWSNASPLMPRLSNTSPLHIKGSAIEDWIPILSTNYSIQPIKAAHENI